jgi:hypothetical protein
MVLSHMQTFGCLDVSHQFGLFVDFRNSAFLDSIKEVKRLAIRATQMTKALSLFLQGTYLDKFINP